MLLTSRMSGEDAEAVSAVEQMGGLAMNLLAYPCEAHELMIALVVLRIQVQNFVDVFKVVLVDLDAQLARQLEERKWCWRRLRLALEWYERDIESQRGDR
jgi:hypothetical protein